MATYDTNLPRMHAGRAGSEHLEPTPEVASQRLVAALESENMHDAIMLSVELRSLARKGNDAAYAVARELAPHIWREDLPDECRGVIRSTLSSLSGYQHPQRQSLDEEVVDGALRAAESGDRLNALSVVHRIVSRPELHANQLFPQVLDALGLNEQPKDTPVDDEDSVLYSLGARLYQSPDINARDREVFRDHVENSIREGIADYLSPESRSYRGRLRQRMIVLLDCAEVALKDEVSSLAKPLADAMDEVKGSLFGSIITALSAMKPTGEIAKKLTAKMGEQLQRTDKWAAHGPRDVFYAVRNLGRVPQELTPAILKLGQRYANSRIKDEGVSAANCALALSSIPASSDNAIDAVEVVSALARKLQKRNFEATALALHRMAERGFPNAEEHWDALLKRSQNNPRRMEVLKSFGSLTP